MTPPVRVVQIEVDGGTLDLFLTMLRSAKARVRFRSINGYLTRWEGGLVARAISAA